MGSLQESRQVLHNIVENIGKVIIGKRHTVEKIVFAMACGGHVLIEDVPGVGKTSLACALARSVDCEFRRIQFTPDILPSDVTGFSIYNKATGKFEFRPGPVMSNFVLADEINRTSPKTQASLLETMEEKCVTVDGRSYHLPQPFMVLATQNPVEYQGTFPLPEAELDRFAICVSLGYPSEEDELRIICGAQVRNNEKLLPVAEADDILLVQRQVSKIHVEREVAMYILAIVTATRNNPEIALGASPRASIMLYRMSQARALYMGREYVMPDDVKALAPCVLEHRLILSREAKISGRKITEIFGGIMKRAQAPSFRHMVPQSG